MAILTLNSVSKIYGALRALDDVSLEVESGEVILLIGRSGSGKSTLLRCVNGLERIDGGEIRFEGTPIDYRRTPLRRLRRHIGFVFQSLNLFPHLTVERNLTIAPCIVAGVPIDEAKERAALALRRVGLTDKADAFPGQLSGGQQQRAAIARAIVMSPRLMLFDEITSALDPELIGEVLAVVGQLAESGMTIVMATHEIRFARRAASRIAFFSAGRIRELGPPDRLLDRPETPELQSFIRSIL